MLRQTFKRILANRTVGLTATKITRSAMVDITDSDGFAKHVLNAEKDRTVIVDFHAGWCGPCRMLAPHLKGAENDNDDVDVVKIDVDEPDVEDLCREYQVQGIPLVLFFRNGEKKFQKVGMMDRGLLDGILADVKK